MKFLVLIIVLLKKVVVNVCEPPKSVDELMQRFALEDDESNEVSLSYCLGDIVALKQFSDW